MSYNTPQEGMMYQQQFVQPPVDTGHQQERRGIRRKFKRMVAQIRENNAQVYTTGM